MLRAHEGQGPDGRRVFLAALDWHYLRADREGDRPTRSRCSPWATAAPKARNGAVFPWNFPPLGSYWTAADVAIQHIAKEWGGLDKLKGKKISLVYHDSPYGKEPIAALEARAKLHGFEFKAIPVTHPGVEQKSQWLAIRQDRPDYVLLWGWGVMNSTAIKEAAGVGFPRDKMMGVWWAGAEPDVIPAGDQSTGYKSLMLQHGAGKFRSTPTWRSTSSPRARRQAKPEDIGHVLYNRGLINSMLGVEAIRTAQKKFGNKPMTGEQVRWGFENLNITAARIKELGFDGMIAPIKLSCNDHRAPHQARIQQWDGKAWKVISDYYKADENIWRRWSRMPPPNMQRRRRSRRATARRRADRNGCNTGRRLLPPPDLFQGNGSGLVTIASAAKPEAGTLILTVNNIEVVYSHVILVLKGVSLDVPKGGIVALLGANGAGKTTTLKAISNLLHAERGEVTKGSILFEGEEVHSRTPNDLVRRGCIQVMEGRRCFGHLTVEENLLTGAFTRRDGKAADRPRSRHGLRLLPAPEGAARLAGRLYLRRRAADVLGRPGADVAPQDDPARRALDGSGAADRRGNLRDREEFEREGIGLLPAG